MDDLNHYLAMVMWIDVGKCQEHFCLTLTDCSLQVTTESDTVAKEATVLDASEKSAVCHS